MNPAHVIVSEVKAESGPQILSLFGESVREAIEPANLHPHGSVLARHDGGTDALGIRRYGSQLVARPQFTVPLHPIGGLSAGRAIRMPLPPTSCGPVRHPDDLARVRPTGLLSIASRSTSCTVIICSTSAFEFCQLVSSLPACTPAAQQSGQITRELHWTDHMLATHGFKGASKGKIEGKRLGVYWPKPGADTGIPVYRSKRKEKEDGVS